MPVESGDYLDFSADAWATISGDYLIFTGDMVVTQGDYLVFDDSPFTGDITLDIALKRKIGIQIGTLEINTVASVSSTIQPKPFASEVVFKGHE